MALRRLLAAILGLVLGIGAAFAQGGIGQLFGGSGDEFLPVEQAFPLTVSVVDDERIVARWDTAEGYYLYRDKIDLDVVGDGNSVERIETPPGEVKNDPYFGRLEVFYGPVAASAYLAEPMQGPLQVRVSYQGCADAGLCYPPETVTVSLAGPGAGAGVATGSGAAPVGVGSVGGLLAGGMAQLSGVLEGGSATLIVGVFFVSGVLLAFTACMYPMIPILSGLIAGDRQRARGGRAFMLSLLYVEASAITYATVGVLAGLSGAAVQASLQGPWVLGGFALLFVLLALSMFGVFTLQMPPALQARVSALSSRQRGGSFVGVAVMGMLSALIVGACSGPALVAALAFVANTGDALLGGVALFALANGMGLPLLLIGTAAGQWLPQAGVWMEAVRGVFGVGFLAVALWLVERFLPGALVLALWGALLLGCGVFVGGLDRLTSDASARLRLRKAAGLLLVVWGVAAVVGAAAGGRDVLRPLQALVAPASAPAASSLALGRFQTIKTTADLDAALAAASAAGRPVMLDVYADWCVYCVKFDEETFSDPTVSRLLADAVLLRADVTANDAADKALMRRLGVYLPPAIIFYDSAGRELSELRVVGFLGPEEFAERARVALYGGA
jgi:thiol:disulfide interchange protein DsbD